MRRGLLDTALVMSAVFLSGAARAQAGGIDLRRFSPPPSPEGALATEPTTTMGPWMWSVGSWLAYDYRALAVTAEDGNDSRQFLIRHRTSFDCFAALGLGESVEVALVVPTVVYQRGAALRTEFELERPAGTALGDLGLRTKVNLLAPGDLGGAGLALLGGVTAPTGRDDAFLGGDAFTGELDAAFELRLLALMVRARGGVRVVSETHTWLGEEYGHELPWALGISLLPQALGLVDSPNLTWNLEAKGAAAVTPSWFSSAQTPAVGSTSLGYSIGDFRVLAGVEAPLNRAVGIPLVRGVVGLSWNPTSPDEDRDGIPDKQDLCPELEEDRDGFDDSDGCPDFDDDNDEIGDEDDRCRYAEEDVDDYQDEDGCPDPDNDGDGLPDKSDSCPLEPGTMVLKGCPERDDDRDEVEDHSDRCPKEAEDRDGFRDEDGCPDPDNDRDGIPDEIDACPTRRAARNAIPELRGCPNPDLDRDTWVNEDQCPRQAEDFDGDRDEDGCPDPEPGGAAPFELKPATAGSQEGETLVVFRAPLRFETGALAPTEWAPLRALGALLAKHHRRTAQIAVKPASDEPAAQQLALDRAFTIVQQLLSWAARRDAAEVVGFAAREGAAPNEEVVVTLTPKPSRRRIPTPPVQPPLPTPSAPVP